MYVNTCSGLAPTHFLFAKKRTRAILVESLHYTCSLSTMMSDQTGYKVSVSVSKIAVFLTVAAVKWSGEYNRYPVNHGSTKGETLHVSHSTINCISIWSRLGTKQINDLTRMSYLWGCQLALKINFWDFTSNIQNLFFEKI